MFQFAIIRFLSYHTQTHVCVYLLKLLKIQRNPDRINNADDKTKPINFERNPEQRKHV